MTKRRTQPRNITIQGVSEIRVLILTSGRTRQEKTFINWRVLPVIKINTRISHTPCLYIFLN
jgi:hypothetical protein